MMKTMAAALLFIAHVGAQESGTTIGTTTTTTTRIAAVNGVSAEALVGTDNGGELLTEARDFDSRCLNIKAVPFDQFIFTPPNFLFTMGPEEVGTTSVPSVGESITYESPNDNVLGNGQFFLSTNGQWDSGSGGYVGINTDISSIDFTFQDELKCCVGGLVNYSPAVAIPGVSLPMMQVLDNAGNVLSTFDYINDGAPISTPNAFNEGAFRGIFRAACDIRTLRILDAFQVLDDLTFSAQAVTSKPSAAPTPLCPPCRDNDDDTKVSMTTTKFGGSCKEKCVPANLVSKFNTLGYECGLCD